VNNKCIFRGKLEKPIVAATFFLRGKGAAQNRTIYLEPANIKAEITTQERKLQDGMNLIYFFIDKVSGSNTNVIYEQYEEFEKKHSADKNFAELSLLKLDELVNINPGNPIVGVLLSRYSTTSTYDKKDLIKVYEKLDKESQNEFNLKSIEKNLFPEMHVTVNGPVFDFELPDKNDILINTKSLKGKWYLIDFWASWCGPCREQIPHLKKLYEQYKGNDFEVIAISIDKDKKQWLKALHAENLSWINVNENKHWYGAIVKRYNVYGIPSNFLINPEGKIFAKDISVEELEKILKAHN
jgi:thiol-disulfide isomerase/thioredoxin